MERDQRTTTITKELPNMPGLISNLQRKTIALGLVAAAALITASAAVAGNVTATATVNGGGALSLTHGGTASVGPVTLDGTDQTVNYTLPLSITDVRGNGNGWNATITSTTFSDGSGHSLAAAASGVSSVTSSCVAGGTCTAPSNSIAYPLTVPAGATAPAAVKLFNAAVNTGMGRFTVTPTIAVAVPGNAFAGTYTSTVTVAAVSGP
jgi:WxL domain surface cell wall-binding